MIEERSGVDYSARRAGYAAESNPRQELLREAEQLVNGDRNNQYGPPDQDFRRSAEAASALGFSLNGKPLSAHDVAIFITVVKLSRLTWSPEKKDSWVDIAGYAACGYEAMILNQETRLRVAE